MCVANSRLERNFLEDSQVSTQLNLKIFELSGSHINHYEIKMAGSGTLRKSYTSPGKDLSGNVQGVYKGEVTQGLFM